MNARPSSPVLVGGGSQHGVEVEHMNVPSNGREHIELQPIPTPSEGWKVGETLAGVLLSSGCSVPGQWACPGVQCAQGVLGSPWGQRSFGCPINTRV